MTRRIFPLCFVCEHKDPMQPNGTVPCNAFPNGIPDDIIGWDDIYFDHRFPYEGDNGIQYERVTTFSKFQESFPIAQQTDMEVIISSILERYDMWLELRKEERGGRVLPLDDE